MDQVCTITSCFLELYAPQKSIALFLQLSSHILCYNVLSWTSHRFIFILIIGQIHSQLGFNLKDTRLAPTSPKYYPCRGPRGLTFSAFIILLCLNLEKDIKKNCYLEHAVCQFCVSTRNIKEKERMKRKKRVDEGGEVDYTFYGGHRPVNNITSIRCNKCLICSGFSENSIDWMSRLKMS